MNLSSSYSDLKSKKVDFKKFKETMKENKIHPDRKEKEKTSGSVEIKSSHSRHAERLLRASEMIDEIWIFQNYYYFFFIQDTLDWQLTKLFRKYGSQFKVHTQRSS